MMLGMYIVIIILNLIMACHNKKSHLIMILTGVFFVFMFAGNSSSGDIPNYLVNYSDPDAMIKVSPLSGLFYFSMKIAKNAGMNFFQYKIVLGIIIYLLYYIFISSFRASPHYIVLFYSFHLFFFDVEQIRNALALSVYLLGLIPLLKNDKNKIKKYIVFTLIASAIHISFIAYLIFLLYFVAWNKSNRAIFVATILSFCLIIFINGNNIPFLSVILDNFDLGGKVGIYFGNHMRFGFLIPFGLQFVCYFTIWYMRNELAIYGYESEIVNVVYRLILLSICFLPLYMLSITFGRFERNLIPLILLAAASLMYQLPKGHIVKWKITIVLIIMVLLWISYDIIARPEDIFIPVMKYNYFVNGGKYIYY